MNATVEDLRATIIPKSDQLNSEQLLAGSMTVTVTDVRLSGGADQPVVVHYANENGRPFKPCLTMRKVLIHAWGPDGRKWIGRSMTLYNDATVKWAGEEVGGIRISHMTDIDRDVKVSLTSTRGKKAKYEIKRLTSRVAGQLAELREALTVETLQAAFGVAYKATKDTGERAQLKAAYDTRLAELQKPAESTDQAKTLEQYREDIDNATSAETAALVLDEARDVLTATEVEQLTQAYDMAWKA